MRERLHATRVLARHRVYETFIGSGFYITETIVLLLAYGLITGFVRSIDSAGFNFQIQPMYELIGRFLNGAFGATFFEKLFAEGPFLFILYVSFLPILLYLAVGSVFRFGLERKVGAVELVVYGPADGTAYFLANIIKDIIFTLAHMLVLIIFFLIAASIGNLVLGPSFFLSIVLLFFLSVTIYAFAVFASVVSENSAAAIVVFLGIILFFIIVLMGSFTIVSGYVRNVSSVLSWIVKWISPFFYWNLGLRAMEIGGWGMYVVSIILSLVLASAVLLASHFILKVKGVRA